MSNNHAAADPHQHVGQLENRFLLLFRGEHALDELAVDKRTRNVRQIIDARSRRGANCRVLGDAGPLVRRKQSAGRLSL